MLQVFRKVSFTIVCLMNLIACNQSKMELNSDATKKLEPINAASTKSLNASQNQPDMKNEKTISLMVQATGLTKAVTLFESHSATHYTIETNGKQSINLIETRGAFNFLVINSQGQKCQFTQKINQDLNLMCGLGACPRHLRPLCAKTPTLNRVCIKAPCNNGQYLTYNNACLASVANAWEALPMACGNLEGVEVDESHRLPGQSIDLRLVDFRSDPFELREKTIQNNLLTVTVAVNGGCGSQDLRFYVGSEFIQAEELQLSSVINLISQDDCKQPMEFSKTFDLLPVIELFRQAFPTAKGEQEILINGIGKFYFRI